MKIIKKIQLETTRAVHPRTIEFELPSYIQAKDVDVYLRGVADLFETLEANTQSPLFNNMLDVINNKGIFVEDN